MLVLLVLFFLGLILPTSTMAKPESISWSDLTVRIREGNGEYKHILKMEYEGAVYHGRLLGILGPSGAGKSTFLNLLSGRMKESNTYAQALAQEALISSNITPALHGQEVAYIHQDDSFFSMLSVMETLDFASQKRLPSESAMTQRSAIEESIQTMSLLTVRDTAVGDPLGKRGISGGERKRLSVACELLSKPKLLIADEPTSGLDSYQALSVVSKIKRRYHIVTCSSFLPSFLFFFVVSMSLSYPSIAACMHSPTRHDV
jgi:ATP-binding cassette, subfamily G (WHITE), member 2